MSFFIKKEGKRFRLWKHSKTGRDIPIGIFPSLKETKKVARELIYYMKHGTYKNPRPVLHQRYYKAAAKTAHYLYNHFKQKGVPRWMIARVPPKIRPIVQDILEYNNVKVRRA